MDRLVVSYAPISPDGHVALAVDHPGFADPAYRARRDGIAAVSASYVPGGPVPLVSYTDEEHATWATVRSSLAPLWESHAAPAFLAGVSALDLPCCSIPQLTAVSAALAPYGWEYLPVAGLAPLRSFYGAFGASQFLSTQYIRHHSSPLYTPEPDICHEVLGHAHQLPSLSALYQSVAACCARLTSDEALGVLSRVFWRTVEFGAVRVDGSVKAWGAGLLSSFGELSAFPTVTHLPVDFPMMGTLAYDITRYQTEVFVAPSWSWVVSDLPEWVSSFDDEAALRLLATAPA